MNEQVPYVVLKIVLPLPNPPLAKGRGLDFSVINESFFTCRGAGPAPSSFLASRAITAIG